MAIFSKRHLAIVGRILIGLYFLIATVQQLDDFIFIDEGPLATGLQLKYRILAARLFRGVSEEEKKGFGFLVTWLLITWKLAGGIGILLQPYFPAYCWLLICEAAITPVFYNFYDYERNTMEYVNLSIGFWRGMAIIGGLLLLMALEMPDEKKPDILLQEVPEASDAAAINKID